MLDQPRCRLFGVNVGADEARRDLARGLTVNRRNRAGNYPPGDLFDESSVYELIEKFGLRVVQPPHVTGDRISNAVDTA